MRVNDLYNVDRSAVASLKPALVREMWSAAADTDIVVDLRRYLGEGARFRGAFLQPAPAHDPLGPLAFGADGVVRCRQVCMLGMERVG